MIRPGIEPSRESIGFTGQMMNSRYSLFRLTDRADMQRCVRELFAPLKRCFSPGGARVRVGVTGAVFSVTAEELEGFARPLWGLSPLAAGGGEFNDWALIRQGLSNGANPRHPEFWGIPSARDQLLVEMAPIGFSLLLAPGQVWQPLSADTQEILGTWLNHVNKTALHDCNWLFFRILVNMGLARVGAPYDRQANTEALNRLEDFYLGDGWYFDGRNGTRDYYIAFAFHFYSLIYAAHAADTDPERAARFKKRADGICIGVHLSLFFGRLRDSLREEPDISFCAGSVLGRPGLCECRSHGLGCRQGPSLSPSSLVVQAAHL